MVTDRRVPPPDPSQDERPSIRVAVAASMLRHGRHPVEIAEVTGVPLAMVALIAEHLDPRHPPAPPCPRQGPPERRPTEPDASITAISSPISGPVQTPTTRPRPVQIADRGVRAAAPSRVRRHHRSIALIGLGWISNTTVSIAAVVHHLHLLALISAALSTVLVIMPLSLLVIGALSRSLPRSRHRR
ncbi:MAG: hypothetical protein ACRDS0_25620 [Pseudonocardiaceae bacterium]